MAHNRAALLVVLAALISSPRYVLSQEPAVPTSKQPCAAPNRCLEETGKTTSADTAPAPPSNSEPQEKIKKKKSRKPDEIGAGDSPNTTTEKNVAAKNTSKQVPAKSKAAANANQSSKQTKLANPECPRPYGYFTPTYCREVENPSGASATTPQGAQGGTVAEPAKPSLDSLFPESAGATTKGVTHAADVDSMSKDELFGLPNTESSPKGESRRIEWRGFIQNETAYTYDDPAHWSRAVIRTQVRAQGGESGLKWKATVRMDVDPVYYGSNFYPQPVREDQRLDFFLRETYVDTSVGGLDFRLGKQNIIWGEMVGLFFADVVSARDQRDFILPDFEIIRIPQWAIRAEYFGEKSHAEVIWLPYPKLDNIGKPGAEFYPFQIPPPPGFSQQFNNEILPDNNLKNSNYGARLSTLRNGWDLSAFYYRSTDVAPTFYREVTLSPTPTLTYTPHHDRIWQAGGTLAKDFGSFVAKGETIYTSGRQFNVTRLTEPTGVVAQDTLDYVLGLDFALPRETRLNLQYFERHFFHHDPDILQDSREIGVSLLISGKIGAKLEPEFLIIQSVNRNDSLMRPKIAWIAERNLRVTFGVDIFTGPITGLFGRFQNRDRAYIESRYDF